MNISQIEKSDIELVASLIESNRNSCENVAKLFDGDLQVQEVNSSIIKYIINNTSADIKSVIIDCVDQQITGVTFYGALKITNNELLEVYGDYTEHYVPYDDAYDIFFKRQGAHGVKTSITYSERKQSNWQDKKLGNISIRLY